MRKWHEAANNCRGSDKVVTMDEVQSKLSSLLDNVRDYFASHVEDLVIKEFVECLRDIDSTSVDKEDL
jgi:hypothetical protein